MHNRAEFGSVRWRYIKQMRYQIQSWADQMLRRLLQEHFLQVTRQNILLPHLPKAFHGKVIVQISDLHIDRWNTLVTEMAVDVVNRVNPDLVVCTGDVIAEGSQYLDEVTYLLKQIKARHGKLACLGNHDYSDGKGSLGVRLALKKAGFDVLVNDSVTLTLEHQQLCLAGTDDLLLGRQCLKTTAQRLGEGKTTVLLSHNPENFTAMAGFKPDLVLSGHTHGGQVHLPGRFHHRFFKSPYIAGLYQLAKSHLYVNRGLGSAVLIRHLGERRLSIPTPRWAVRPEISVFTLLNPKLLPQPDSTVVRLEPAGLADISDRSVAVS